VLASQPTQGRTDCVDHSACLADEGVARGPGDAFFVVCGSAKLQFFIAGFADVGAVDLLADGVVFGSYNFSPPNTLNHILSIGVPLVNIDGLTTFSFFGPSSDGWILDFAELTIETRSVVVPDVPAPASLIVWGMGGGLAFLGKKMRRGRKAEVAA